MNKNLPAFILLLGFSLIGCQSAGYAYTQVYPNPLYSNDEKLSFAVRTGDLFNINKYLAKGANPNTNKVLCWTPYTSLDAKVEKNCLPPMIAAFKHEPNIVEVLTNNGGDINQSFDTLFTDTEMNPLLFWVAANDEVSVKKVLMHKPNVNSLLSNGEAALTLAVNNNNSKILEMLLIAGADPNYVNKNGINALTISVRNNNPEISKLLIEHGAKPDKWFWSEVRHYNSSTSFIRTVYESINKDKQGASIYIGDSADIYNSIAIVISKDGSRYEGLIKNGKPNGSGRFITSTGAIFNGVFEDGNLKNGSITVNDTKVKVVNSFPVHPESAKKVQKEYLKAKSSINHKSDKTSKTQKNNYSSDSNDALKDAGEFVLGLAILPLYIVVETLSAIDWAEVAADLPEEYVRAKREQERVNAAYIRGMNQGRASCSGKRC